MSKNEKISAFAFKTGRLIEDLINETTNNLKDYNQFLEASILGFRNKLLKEQDPYLYVPDLIKSYNEFFDISITTRGKIE